MIDDGDLNIFWRDRNNNQKRKRMAVKAYHAC
jgi:hypothetical protein